MKNKYVVAMTGLVAALLLLGATTVLPPCRRTMRQTPTKICPFTTMDMFSVNHHMSKMETTLRAVTSVIGVMIYREIL